MSADQWFHEARWTYLSLAAALFLSIFLSVVSVASINECDDKTSQSICLPIVALNGLISVVQFVSFALTLVLAFGCQGKRTLFGYVTLVLVTLSFILAAVSSLITLWHRTYQIPNLPAVADLTVSIALVDFVIILIAIIPYRHYSLSNRKSPGLSG